MNPILSNIPSLAILNMSN